MDSPFINIHSICYVVNISGLCLSWKLISFWHATATPLTETPWTPPSPLAIEASYCSAEPPYSEASEILDMAVCCYPPGVFRFDDYILQLLGLYPTWLSWIFTIVLNISVSLALYSVVVFYHVFAKELAPHKPLAKFLCIKEIVFFCFWQGMVLEGLAAVGIIQSLKFLLDVEHIKEAMQNILVCIAMVIFSVLQQYAYYVAPYSGEV